MIECWACPFECDCMEDARTRRTFNPPAHCPRLAGPSNLGERDGGDIMDAIQNAQTLRELTPEARRLVECLQNVKGGEAKVEVRRRVIYNG